jgi:hypothetical protein
MKGREASLKIGFLKAKGFVLGGVVALCCPEASGRQGYGACTLLVAGFSFIFN